MPGQISQVDLINTDGSDPLRFVQLRFETGETPSGQILFYDSKSSSSSVFESSATINVTGATPAFTLDGFDYYNFPVSTDLLAGNQQGFAVVYADGGEPQSTLLFGNDTTNVDGRTFEGGPFAGETVGSVVAGGTVEGGGFQPGTGPFAVDPDGGVSTGPSDPNQPCFLAGTMIATPAGEVAVESLRAGDLVLTADGRALPVTWVGHRRVARLFADALLGLPVRIAAGALGENTPARDLLVSPNHAMLVDGLLVEAGALVNGTTITRAPRAALPELFTYHHVELAQHEVILAEGAASESFVDNVSRAVFDNAAEHPGAAAMVELDLPRVTAARQLPAATRARLEALAAARPERVAA